MVNCASGDLINLEDQDLTTQSLEKNSLTLARTTLNINETAEVMDLSFLSNSHNPLDIGIFNPPNGGCTFTDSYNGTSFFDSTEAYGPNPTSFYNYIFRGYGKPRTSIKWRGLKFVTGNQPKKVISRGQTILVDDQTSNAISIEFPFQANITYEITITALIVDNIYEVKHDMYKSNDHLYNINQSEAFPTLAVQLKDSPEIPGDDPCANRPVVGNGLSSANYYKRQKAEITTIPQYKELKTFVFNFSTTENKNAVIIYFSPELSGSIPQYIPESSFSMHLYKLKMVQKPFDPTYYVKGSGYRD